MATGIYGLASGFQSADYITAVMNQEKIPLTNLQTKQSKLTAFKSAFTTLNTKMNTLKTAATALKDVVNFQTLKSTSSDTTKMTVTAGATATAGSYSVNVSSLASAQVTAIQGFKSDSTDFPTSIKINGTTDITLPDKEGKTTDEWLSAAVKEINSKTNLGITAAVVQTSPTEKAITLTANKTGSANKFDVALDTEDYPYKINTIDAQDASFTVNGLAITSSSNSVENAIPGVTLNLINTGTSTVKVTQDTAAITDKIDAFVKAYNDIVTSIKNSTAAPVDSSSSNSSNKLSLQGDSLLRDLQSQLNNMMNTIVGDTDGFKLLSDIGLEIDKGATSAAEMTGNITFDKDKFLSKLTENSDAVQKIFTGNTVYEGLGSAFEKKIKSYTDSVDGMITTKIKGYSDDINFISDQISEMQVRLDLKEASLKKTYSNLEVVMSSLNNTSSWLTSQFAALTKSSK